jgi:predicted nuclease of predicted toxin-antitoxin system
VKLLFDQNLSAKLVAELRHEFPGSAHVRELGFERRDDDVIWRFAATNGFTIVSKDADFHQRSFLFGAPPKVVWLRLGNSNTRAVLDLLRASRRELEDFERHSDAAFLVLS